jgi:hypothetical protein
MTTSPPASDPRPHRASLDPGQEPSVAVPAGLVGLAVELLDLCDELLNRPGHDCIDAQVHALTSHYQHRQPATAAQWLHTALGATAEDLQAHLDDEHIIVEPTLRGHRSISCVFSCWFA